VDSNRWSARSGVEPRGEQWPARVTDAVLEDVRESQNRPLDPVSPVIFFDALRGNPI
jgi:hypothetical protein